MRSGLLFRPVLWTALPAAVAASFGPPAAAQDRGNAPPSRSVSPFPASLDAALQTVPWDVSEKGVLLSVGINSAAEPARLRKRPPIEVSGQGNPVPVTAKGYRPQDVFAYFGRHMVSAGSVMVLAPTMTTVLATRLPKPALYADLSRTDKLRRLESTLSPAQWRLLASPNGLGEGDLKPTQKSIWGSLLPDPLILTRTRNENGKAITYYEGEPKPVPVSAAQRAGMRLTLYRTMSWVFTTTEPNNRGGTVEIGVNTPTGPDGTETFSLREDMYYGGNDPQTMLFGVLVRDVVPDRPKPSDIDYDNAVLDTSISLLQAKTVGDVIGRIKEKTGVDIYCDPRYRSLSVWTRGGDAHTVRAGDLLKALALGVSGTFRRVFDGKSAAYVLTDDLEGLGARQARISEWAQAAAAQREGEDAVVEAALGKINIGDYVGWRDGDPFAPTGDLARRVEEYRNGKAAPVSIEGKPSGSYLAGLWVPISDLPASAQDQVKQQVESWNRGIEEEQKRNEPDEFRSHRAPLRTDRVKLNVQTGMAFTIPGVGRVEVGANGGWMNRPQDLLPTPGMGEPRRITQRPALGGAGATASQETAPFHLTQPGGTIRALLVALPQNADAAKKAVSAAKAHGFNELWVETPLQEKTSQMLIETIAAAKARVLDVQAVVRVLRRPAGAVPDLARDLNLLGETMTQWATRRAAVPTPELPELSVAFDPFRSDYTAHQRKLAVQNALYQKDYGDYLDVGSPAGEAAVLANLQTLAQTPGLAGIVVRDVNAPGSSGAMLNVFSNTGIQSVVEDFGYTPAHRLSFLRLTGIDPVDLSPLRGGQVSLPWGMGRTFGPPPSIGLPQMPDYGPAAQSSTISDASALTPGAQNGQQRWNTFRKEQADAFWSRLQKNAVANSPRAPLLRQNYYTGVSNGVAGRVSWTGTWDKVVPQPTPEKRAVLSVQTGRLPRPIVPSAAASTVPYLERAHQGSSQALLTFRFDPAGQNPVPALANGNGATPLNEAQQFAALLAATLRPYQNGWDGLVIDLSGMPTETALPLLA